MRDNPIYIYFTKNETEKLMTLAGVFNCNQKEVVLKALEISNDFETIKFSEEEIPHVKEKSNKSFRFTQKELEDLKNYGFEHFRDFQNTIRFLINALYKTIFDNKGEK